MRREKRMTKPILYIGNRNYSSWSLRPYMALAMAGVEFDTKLIRFGEPEFGRKVRRISKAGLVPILVHDDIKIWETLAILEYAAETWPKKKFWPTNKKARALARSVSSEMHAGFKNLRNECPMNIRRPKKSIKVSDGVLKEVARLENLWAQCRKEFGKGGPFLFGKFSNADAMFAPVVSRLETFNFKVKPETRQYMDAVLNSTAFMEWQKLALKERWIVTEDEVDEV
jgi:glutathione S-transferase